MIILSYKKNEFYFFYLLNGINLLLDLTLVQMKHTNSKTFLCFFS